MSYLNKKKCYLWDKCTRTSSSQKDREHKDKYFHPCKFGLHCQKCDNKVHMERFIHICKHGISCTDKSPKHRKLFSHPSLASNYVPMEFKKPCKYWDHCKKTGSTEKERKHKDKYYHPCKYGNGCTKTNDSIHQNRFIHSCKHGIHCNNYSVNHRYCFSHPQDLKYNQIRYIPTAPSYPIPEKQFVELQKNSTPTKRKIEPKKTKENEIVKVKHVAIDQKIRCKYWDKCTLLGSTKKEQEHQEEFYHPCKDGDSCKRKKDEIHRNRFVHPCWFGDKCEDKTFFHNLYFSHDLHVVNDKTVVPIVHSSQKKEENDSLIIKQKE